MKKVKFFLASVVCTLLGAQSVSAATCTLNGEVVPCDQIPKWILFIPVLLLVVFIPFIVFWVKMLIHAIKNQKENKVVWVLVIVFLQILGAIIYYFAEKRPMDKLEKVAKV